MTKFPHHGGRMAAGALLLLVALLAPSPAPGQILNNRLYIMEDASNAEKLYILEFDDIFDLLNSSVSVGSAINMDSQLGGDFRSIDVLTDGRLIVETVNANRLSYWDADGNYDSATGQFGGNLSAGVAALYDGTFISQNAGGSGEYRIYGNGDTAPDYTLNVSQEDGTTAMVSSYWRLAGRQDGGFVAGVAANTSPLVSLYDSTGSAGSTNLAAVTTADVSPDLADVGQMAPFAGGWAGRSGGVDWYAYSAATNVSGDFPGTKVSGTVGGRITDITSLGLDHTAVLFISTSFAPTATGNSFVQVWANADLASGPVRTIDLGFNLSAASQEWNRSQLAGGLYFAPTWAGGAVNGGWGEGSNWVGGVAPTFGTGAILDWYAAGSGQLTSFLGGDRTLGRLNFNNNTHSNVVVRTTTTADGSTDAFLVFETSSGEAQISVQNGATADISLGVVGTGGGVRLENSLTIDHGGSGRFSVVGPISEGAASAGLTKQGSGTLILDGSSTFSGGVTLSGGTVRLADGSAAGSGAVLQSDATSVLEIDTLDTITNSLSVYNVAFLQGATLSGAVTVNNADFHVVEGESATISGVMDGEGGVTKTGPGLLTISGDNSYTGPVEVDGGTLELASTVGGAAAATISLSVASGATLLLSQSGQVNDAATVSLSGGTIQRASGVSEVFGNLDVSSSSFLDFGSGTEGTLSFGTYTASALLTVNNFFQGNVLTFGSDLTGSINNTNSFVFNNAFTSTWDAGTDTFTITAIPEPSTWLAALLLAALLLRGCPWPIRHPVIFCCTGGSKRFSESGVESGRCVRRPSYHQHQQPPTPKHNP